MTMNTKVLLLLAVTVCIAVAHRSVSQRCLCRRVINKYRGSAVENIEIFPPSPSCYNLEIIVRLKNGIQYCLNPEMKIVQTLLANFMKKSTPATLSGTEPIPFESSTDSTHM